MLKKHSYKQGYLNKFFTLIFLVFCAAPGWAQQFSLGVKGGPLLVWPGFGDKEAKDEFGRKIKPGFSAGILIDFPLKTRYNLILEAGYSQRSRTVTFEGNGKYSNTVTFPMIDMSMLLRRSYNFMLWKNIPAQGFLNLGPEINYWFNPRGHLDRDGKPYRYNVVLNETPTANFRNLYLNNMNQWLFGIGLGGGLRAPLKRNHHLLTEIRFVSGHTFLGKADSDHLEILDYKDTFKTNLKTVSFSVAYTIDIDLKQSRMGKSTVKETNKGKGSSKKKRR